MAIVTLTTDWGLKDHYAASVKGSLLRQIPNIQIIDITHQIQPFNLREASYVLKSAFPSFPAGTIHLIGINTEASLEQPHIVAKCKGQYFVGSDNGIFSLVLGKEPMEIIEIDIIQDSDKFTFSTKDVFVKAAKHLAGGGKITDLGIPKQSVNELVTFEPTIEQTPEYTIIVGKVIYLDRYENAITNISESLFNQYAKGHQFDIMFSSYQNELTQISKSYLDVHQGDPCALFDSNNLLEISICMGNAGSLLGLKVDQRVRIVINH